MMRARPCLVLMLVVASAMTVSGCGLRPLYANGQQGVVATGLRDITVGPIAGQGGWMVRNALRDRLEPATSGAARQTRYRLQVVLDDQLTGFGVRSDDSITRERRIMRARFTLVDIATGATLLDATTGSDAGIDVVSSEYATIAAEESAQERLAGVLADQIVARLALYLRNPDGPVTPAAIPPVP